MRVHDRHSLKVVLKNCSIKYKNNSLTLSAPRVIPHRYVFSHLGSKLNEWSAICSADRFLDYANTRSMARCSGIRITFDGICDRLRIGAVNSRVNTRRRHPGPPVFVACYFSCLLGLCIVGHYRVRFVSAPVRDI